MAREFLRTERGERIDQPDVEQMSDDALRSIVDPIFAQYAVGNDAPNTSYVLRGFAATDAGTVLTVAGGAAIAGYSIDGVAKLGAFVTEGDATRSIDLQNYADGTYGVYVRLEYRADEYGNRVFWNPLAVTPVEYVRSIPTRNVENWGLAVEMTSPGTEWLHICDVAKSGAALTPTDKRNFLLEGQLANSYAVVDAEWGATADRNSNRATYGVFGLYRAIRALQRQVQDIIGGTAQWWKTIPTSITALISDKLARDGSQTMNGDLVPGTDSAYELGDGTTPKRWQNLHVDEINSGTLIPLQDMVWDVGENSTPLRWRYVWAQEGKLSDGADFFAPGTTQLQMSSGAASIAKRGVVKLEPTSGDSGNARMTLGGASSSAIDNIDLDSTTTALSAICEGIKGIAYATVTLGSGKSIPANSSAPFTQAFSPPTSGNVNESSAYLVSFSPRNDTVNDLASDDIGVGGVSLTSVNNEVNILLVNPTGSTVVTTYNMEFEAIMFRK